MPCNNAMEASQGLCLSLHQPWASLLVRGIKRIEGRDWPSNYRGRLWIHATNQASDRRTIQELEDFYKRVYDAEGLEPEFPQTYPTGALVGCVHVSDVLTAEQVEAWPELPPSVKLEIGSPYEFLCEAPQMLTVPIYTRGWPRLWALPPHTLHRAERFLVTPPQVGPKPFSWRNFDQPDDLRTRKLPPHPNRHYFRSKYGSVPSPEHSRKRVLPEPGTAQATIQAPREHVCHGNPHPWGSVGSLLTSLRSNAAV